MREAQCCTVGSEVGREEELLNKADKEENEARSCQCVVFHSLVDKSLERCEAI